MFELAQTSHVGRLSNETEIPGQHPAVLAILAKAPDLLKMSSWTCSSVESADDFSPRSLLVVTI